MMTEVRKKGRFQFHAGRQSVAASESRPTAARREIRRQFEFTKPLFHGPLICDKMVNPTFDSGMML